MIVRYSFTVAQPQKPYNGFYIALSWYKDSSGIFFFYEWLITSVGAYQHVGFIYCLVISWCIQEWYLPWICLSQCSHIHRIVLEVYFKLEILCLFFYFSAFVCIFFDIVIDKWYQQISRSIFCMRF